MPLIAKKGSECLKFVNKRICSILLSLVILFGFTVTSSAVSLTYDGLDYPNSEPIFIESGVTYVSARAMLDLREENSASWDPHNSRASFYTDTLELLLDVGNTDILANGTVLSSQLPVILVNGRVCLPVRALASALGASVGFDSHNTHITLKTINNYPGSESTYSAEDLYWMSRIIHAESCGESYLGKLLVGEVVMNRKRSESFPHTVYDVIFDRKNGVQFTPIANGTVYNDPCDECVNAAIASLIGVSRMKNAMYFVNMSLVPVSWVSQNRPVIAKIGNHTFFA